MPKSFQIGFDYPLAQDRKTIHLTAKVEAENTGTYYAVSDIKTSSGMEAIPPRNIKKFKGEWVHVDSGRSTTLSVIIGKAIDAMLGE